MTNSDKSGGGNVADVKGGLSVIQDFYLEFFGTLLPGVIAVTSAVLLGLGFYYYITGDVEFVTAASRYAFGTWETGLLYLAMSYVMGVIAYRRNPRTPDTISAHWQWRVTLKSSSSDEVERLAVSFDPDKAIPRGVIGHLKFWWNRERWILRHADHNIDYPYPHMRRYLYCRGLAHLAEYVPWCAGSGGLAFRGLFEKGKCSKQYVNIIKQRLRNSGRSSLVLDMVRNECSIRMLSSFWYILTFVKKMLLFAIPFALLAIPVKHLVTPNEDHGQARQIDDVVLQTADTNGYWKMELMSCVCQAASSGGSDDDRIIRICKRIFVPDRSERVRIIWFMFLTLDSIALVLYCKNSVENRFHYVRTREVVMILESAWLLENVESGGNMRKKTVHRKSDLFSDIKELANKFTESHCCVCKYCKKCHGDD